MDGQYLEILIFAVFAALIIFRLRNVLGRRTGNERPPPEAIARRQDREGTSDNIVRLADSENADKPGASEEVARSPLEIGLAAVQTADRNFSTEGFLDGARAAFETIVSTFAEGDLDQLKRLLSKDVYENFADAIQARYDARETLETTLVGIKSVALMDAGVEGRTAQITIKFVSEQINVTRDRDGNIVDGNPDDVTDIIDIWTFARDIRSRDPNWALVETTSSN